MATAPLARRGTFAGPDGNFLQLDLTGGEGFSGAPVVRRSGAVVGVVTDEDPQLTFAVKALVARDAVIGWGGNVGSSAGTSAKIPPLWPDPKVCVPGQKRLQNGIVFIRICPGTFTMGSIENDPLASPDEKPAHQVKLREFWIGKTEITNEQYRRFLPYHQGEASLPSVDISWANAKAACEHFGGRLPTEAEWEYAARAGTQAPWSFGDDEQILTDYAWHDKNSGDMVHPVGIKKPNAWGLHDMYGNVWEWVADWYGTYLGAAQTDPSGPTTGEYHVMRGGAFAFSAKLLRSAFRGMDVPFYRFGSTGFRCALSQAPPPKEPVKVDFKVGSARLLNIAKPQLDLVALQMQEDKTVQAQVIANSTAGSSANSAQRLNEQRIQAVKSYLAVRHGIDPEHIKTEGRWAVDSIDNAVADHPPVIVIIIGEFSS